MLNSMNAVKHKEVCHQEMIDEQIEMMKDEGMVNIKVKLLDNGLARVTGVLIFEEDEMEGACYV